MSREVIVDSCEYCPFFDEIDMESDGITGYCELIDNFTLADDPPIPDDCILPENKKFNMYVVITPDLTKEQIANLIVKALRTIPSAYEGD